MSRSTRLWIVLALNVALVGVLVVTGVSAHSVGVLAEGGDYLADAAAIGIALLAIWLRPHGYPRATTWAALVTGGWLLVVMALVAAEAMRRITSGAEHVHGLPVLVTSGVAAVAMVAGAVVLGGDVDDGDDEGSRLNMHAVLLETIADAAIAGAVAIVGAVILVAGGFYWLDPLVALLVTVVVAYHALALLRRVLRALRTERRWA